MFYDFPASVLDGIKVQPGEKYEVNLKCCESRFSPLFPIILLVCVLVTDPSPL